MARPLHVLLASPRGFCAGVVRAIAAVEDALRRYGPPVYVRRAIVHNLAVVRSLERQGAVFVEELDEVAAGAPAVLSAHGVAASVRQRGMALGLQLIDATCPLVAKVHRELVRHHRSGRHVMLIGHAGHPEIIGAMGQVPDGAVTLVGCPDDVGALSAAADAPLAYAVQTTFSVEDAEAIVAALQTRFPDLVGPPSSDICYATTNRQEAVRALAGAVDFALILGESFSSNANRLVEVARAQGCRTRLVADVSAVDWDWFDGVGTLGISSAASTPEVSVRDLLDVLAMHFRVSTTEIGGIVERTAFKPVAV